MTMDHVRPALRPTVHSLMTAARADLARLGAPPPSVDGAAATRHLVAALFAAGLRDVQTHADAGGGPVVVGHRPAPAGAPTVVLYSHHDADGRGDVVAQLTALRALGRDLPVGVIVIVDGSRYAGADALTGLVNGYAARHPVDAIVIGDAGGGAVGVPTLTTTMRGLAEVVVTVRTLAAPVPAGRFAGPVPDALAALIRMLGTLRDNRGDTTIHTLDSRQRWSGVEYDAARCRADAGLVRGVQFVGSGSVADMTWARPAVTVLGIDCPSVDGSPGTLPAEVRARVSLRVPPGVDAAHAQAALVKHLYAVAPWRVQVEVEPRTLRESFASRTDGRAFVTLWAALTEAYGHEVVARGFGGSPAPCAALRAAWPEAEIMLTGLADPGELERLALAQALFLWDLAPHRT
jgi:acetylornithine deacetylase/succinyl-diaminopimelate desuccinylase-like protein